MPYRFDAGRFVALVLMIIVLFVLFAFGGFYGPYSGLAFNTDTLLLLLALVLLAFAASFTKVVPSEDRFDVITEARCPTCGFIVTRPFVVGDYVSKEDKPCPKDGTTTLIHKIYVNDEAQPRQPF